jgi:uncharacterized protein (DUF2147 family)
VKASKIFAALLALFFLAANATPDPICGLWWNEERDAKLEIYKKGDTFEAKIAWLKEPNADGKPKVDKNNPDPKLRSRPVLGLVILRGLRKTNAPDFYNNGRIYDPKNGRTYNCRVTLTEKRLALRGFVLGLPFFGRTAVWSRAD